MSRKHLARARDPLDLDVKVVVADDDPGFPLQTPPETLGSVEFTWGLDDEHRFAFTPSVDTYGSPDRLLQNAAEFMRLLLTTAMGDADHRGYDMLEADESLMAAARVAVAALHRLAFARRHHDEVTAVATVAAGRNRTIVAEMARAFDEHRDAELAAIRQRIKDTVAWSDEDDVSPKEEWIHDDEDEDGGGVCVVPIEVRLARRASFLRTELPKIDPRLALSEAEAVAVLKRFGRRANGLVRLAANWAWRSGFEGRPRAKESRIVAPPRIVDRYRDTKKKRAARKRRTRQRVR